MTEVVYTCFVYFGWFLIVSATIIAHVSTSGLVVGLLLRRVRLRIIRTIFATALGTGEGVRSVLLRNIPFEAYFELPHKQI